MTKSCRVNTAVTRLLNGRRSLAHWLSDCRRLLYNRAGSAAARLNRFHFVDLAGTDETLAKVWLVPNARHVCNHELAACIVERFGRRRTSYPRRDLVRSIGVPGPWSRAQQATEAWESADALSRLKRSLSWCDRLPGRVSKFKSRRLRA